MPQIIAASAAEALAEQRRRQPAPLTNGAALAIVAAWRRLIAGWGQRWDLADTYALTAYGQSSPLDDSWSQRDAPFPALAVSLMEADLDRLAAAAPPGKVELQIDDVWDDLKARDDLSRRGAMDGHKIEWKVPLPMCKGGKLPSRSKDGKWTCDVQTIDDPITTVAQPAMVLAAALIALWLWRK